MSPCLRGPATFGACRPWIGRPAGDDVCGSRPRCAERAGRRRSVRRRTSRDHRGSPLRERAREAGGHPSLGHPRPLPRSARRAARGSRAGRSGRLDRCRLVGDRLRARRPRRAPASESRPLPGRSSGPGRRQRARADLRAGALRPHGHPVAPDQHDLRARGHGRRAGPLAGRRRLDPADPGSGALVALRCPRARNGRTPARRSASTLERAAGRATSSSGSTSLPASCPRSSSPEPASARSRLPLPTRHTSMGRTSWPSPPTTPARRSQPCPSAAPTPSSSAWAPGRSSASRWTSR